MAFTEIIPRSRLNSLSKNADQVVLSVVKSGHGRMSLNFHIPRKLSADLRWKEGDRIKVLFDDECVTKWALQRVDIGGYMLSKNNRNASRKTKLIIAITMPEKLPFKHGDRFECVVDKLKKHGDICFDIVQLRV